MRGKSIESHVWHVGVSGGRADSLDTLKLLNGVSISIWVRYICTDCRGACGVERWRRGIGLNAALMSSSGRRLAMRIPSISIL